MDPYQEIDIGTSSILYLSSEDEIRLAPENLPPLGKDILGFALPCWEMLPNLISVH